jgi:hypothetical protein
MFFAKTSKAQYFIRHDDDSLTRGEKVPRAIALDEAEKECGVVHIGLPYPDEMLAHYVVVGGKLYRLALSRLPWEPMVYWDRARSDDRVTDPAYSSVGYEYALRHTTVAELRNRYAKENR